MFTVFIDVTEFHSIEIAKVSNISEGVCICDYRANYSTGANVHYSVWKNGKCYYSTNINVKLDGFTD